MTENSAKQLRQRQFLMAIPVLCYPFLVLLFWSLGGGQGVAAVDTPRPQSGINKTIPQANNSRPVPERLSLYALADQDSARIKELQRLEARRLGLDTTDDLSGDYLKPDATGNDGIYTGAAKSVTDVNEQKVNRKLFQLQQKLDEATQTTAAPPASGLTMGKNTDSALNNIRLMMDQADQGPADPELATINQMLHTIRDIQNHGSETDKIKKQSAIDRSRVFTVAAGSDEVTVQSFGGGPHRFVDSSGTVTPSPAALSVGMERHAGFYDLEGQLPEAGHNTIGAIVYKNATVVNEATLQLMLTDDIYLSGRLIPKGAFVFGPVKISNERVMVAIRTIQYDKSIYPVNLAVYGLDGQEGIPAPGAITQDASSQGMDNAMQLMNMGSMDPSIGAQAASAGIQTAKSLLSRKVHLVKATVRAGDAVLLVDATAVAK